MFFYYVWVRSNRYHGNEALTYASTERLKSGSIVQVELQKEVVLGVVMGSTSRPRFKTKEIIRIYDLPLLSVNLMKLMQWLKSYYPAPVGVLTQQILPVTLTDKQLEIEFESKNISISKDALPVLTLEQQNALSEIQSAGSYLLHGVTGSGKTRLYMELAMQAIESGKSVLILTPEISLTSQLANNFRAVFGERVVVMHSQQPPSVRLKNWLYCLKTDEPLIIIGPRSILFSPMRSLGLIVLDESHETAYKQMQAPQYQSVRVAAYLANIHRSIMVLGSATPSVSDYYLAQQKHRPIITLKHLAQSKEQQANEVTIVDRKDHDLFTRSPHLSLPLIKALERALNSREQSLLYLNRRGTARLIMCENCGWEATCPHCDLPLTYHADSHSLRCHCCNYHTTAHSTCPVCNYPSILFKTAGTKAIVEEVQRLFPNARIARFDTDNLRAERFEQQYETVYAGEVDILVGTQLLAKGLDLPLLSTLGIILADTSLYMPDFSAQERTYQLISQVLGRIGRGHIPGRAIIQTYHPHHPILNTALRGDYQAFYDAELSTREQFVFPPFCYLLKLSIRRASFPAAEAAALKLKQEIENSTTQVRVEGPAPCFHERFEKKYQWQLVVKASNRSELLRIIEHLPANWSYDIDPVDLL